MGFKLPGKSMTSGTSSHSSALKMKEEEQHAASALKQKATTYAEAYEKNLEYVDDADYAVKKDKWGRKYGTDVDKEAMRGKTEEEQRKDRVSRSKKSEAEFTKAAKAWNMKTYGTHNPTADAKKAGMTKKELAAKHKASKTTTAPPATTKPTKTEKVVSKGETKKAKITAKAAKRTGEVDENVGKKVAGLSKREAKKKYGKGSKEHLEAKLAHQKAKGADITGEKGGRKRGLFRGLATRRNIKAQGKTQAKIDALKK